MYAIDPREFQYEIHNYEIAKKKYEQLSADDIKNLEAYLSINEEVQKNESTFHHKRERRKVAPAEYEKVKGEYWSRGAGYNVEYLKIQRDKLKKEIIDLEKILIEPDIELENLYKSLNFFKSTNLDLNFYEIFKKSFQKYEIEISFYSVFKLIEGEDEIVFCIVPKSVSELNIFRNFKLLSDRSPLARICLGRSAGESFLYLDGDGSERQFMVSSTRLMTMVEMEDLIQKRNRNLVVKESTGVVDLNSWTSNNTRYRKGG
jgi:hypothetical protein